MNRLGRRVRLGVALATLAAGVLAVVAYAAPSITIGPNEVNSSIEKAVNRAIPNSQSNAHVPSSGVPRPASSPVDSSAGAATGFAGLNHFQQRNVADGGKQFSLEPPDQGLCVGGSTVIEAVNDIFATYSTAGAMTGGPTSLTMFYTGQHQIVRSPLTYGPFLSDPKCYFDPQLQRFFMTVLEIDQNASTGAFDGGSHELIAVSKSATPSTAAGDWYQYSIDTTNTSLSGHSGCPCFGDQPLIGADKYGFYITTNEFSINGPQFNGAQVYAFDKAALASGTLRYQYVAGEGGLVPLAEGPAYSLQPATSPTAADWSSAAGGTEYLLSALDFNGTLDNRVAVWALTNTSSLTSASPDVQLSSVILPSEVYGQPPDATQKSGSTPLATIIQQLYGAKNAGSSSAPQEELLAGNDDRMNQAVYANGQLWGALNTVVKTQNGPSHVGSAYFDVAPSVGVSGLAASMTSQGYVSANNQNLLYPSIGVTSAGKAVYTATLAGPDYYPSAIYTTIDPSTGPGTIHLVGAGLGPDDGFTGYPPFGGPTARWGDYSAAVSDPAGNVWFATEYIGQTCTAAAFYADTTCGGTRTILANWGTYVGKVTP
ncbi:MAG TPA: hypothetical protein VNC40_12925 [Gaiellaceae bacterium]|nr:hypothetical protein [Gaiellaceae bacterium]